MTQETKVGPMVWQMRNCGAKWYMSIRRITELLTPNFNEMEKKMNVLNQWWPTSGTRATSGTRMFSKWLTQSQFINADSRNWTFPGNMFLHFCFLPYQTWSSDIVADSCRHTYVKKQFPSWTWVKSKYRSVLTDHHLKNLLALASSSVNPNIE